jgi:CTP:phosphocholine cytidylyltransferase-like protein
MSIYSSIYFFEKNFLDKRISLTQKEEAKDQNKKEYWTLHLVCINSSQLRAAELLTRKLKEQLSYC